MEIGIERIGDVWAELDVLLHDYFERTQAKDDTPPIDMDWAMFTALNDRGHMVLFTARDDDDDLIGFAMYYVHIHLHHKGRVGAACDIIAVNPDHRGQGVATAMIKHAEQVFKHKGMKFVTHGFRVNYDVEPLFLRLGYRLVERSYMKELN